MIRVKRRLSALVVPIAVGALVLSGCGAANNGGQQNNAQVRQQGTSDINPVSADQVKELVAYIRAFGKKK